jgi:hypothetical protein
VADFSPGLSDLGLSIDDEAEIIFPPLEKTK